MTDSENHSRWNFQEGPRSRRVKDSWSWTGSWFPSSFMKDCLPWDSVVIHSLVFSSILIPIFLFKLLSCPPLNSWWSLSFRQWPLLLVLWTFLQFSSAQSLSRVRLFATPWTAACQASLSITNSQSPPNPCPLSRWCHPTISSSVVPFSSRLQPFPASGSFQTSQFFASVVLEFQVQHQSSQWIFRTDFL